MSPLSLACSLLFTIGVACGAVEVDPATLQDPPGDPITTALAKDKPWVPGWCRWDWRAGWMGQHRAMCERSRAGGIEVVFFGDSLTAGWNDPGGKPTWDERFAPLKAVNYGIGGDSTRQLLYRIRHGAIDGIAPKVVVLGIGTNNLYDDANGGSDEEIASAIATVVKLIRSKLPGGRILLLGILPRQNEWFCGRVAAINARIERLDDGAAVRFLDMGPVFAPAFGKVDARLYDKDLLHLHRDGYRAWAETMSPLLMEMLDR
jgi:platelet-activating factor acetylhydrolase IB subunit beta/gamma